MFNFAIVVHRENATTARIETEDFDFLCMMREYFSFFADGYKFHPAYKNKSWDGKIRLLEVTGEIPAGLVPEVARFCARHSKQVFVDPRIRTLKLDRDVYQTFVNNLDVRDGGDSIDPYDYQVNASHWALENVRGILLSPTSSGKSLIQYMLIRMYLQIYPEAKFLIIVPNIGLVTQMMGDFDNYASEIDWCVADHITNIKEGKIIDDSKRVVLSTYQSLTNNKTMPEREFFHQFKGVMVDEVHTAQSKSVRYIMDSSINAHIRIGLTGTLQESKTHEMVLRGLFGEVYEVITTAELMDAGTVAQLSVNVGILGYPDKERSFLRSADRGKKHKKTGKPIRSKADYKEEMKYITSHKGRNRFIMRFAAGLEGNTIIMINEIEHGENLYKWMKEVLPDRDIFLYTGSTKADEREKIRQLMEEKPNAIIIGSLGVLSTGISIKRLHNMVFCHPSKSRVKVLQSIGRLLRKSKHGNKVNMYDLVDDFCIGAYVNYTYEHGKIRTSFYMDQKFETNITNIDILGE